MSVHVLSVLCTNGLAPRFCYCYRARFSPVMTTGGATARLIGRASSRDVKKDNPWHYGRDDVLDAVAEEAEERRE